eukprot:359435-Chlamydomonas_euryale.AAC.4
MPQDNSSSVPVRWREYTFLENPRCPESVKSSRLTIYTSTVSSPVPPFLPFPSPLTTSFPRNVSPPRPPAANALLFDRLVRIDWFEISVCAVDFLTA